MRYHETQENLNKIPNLGGEAKKKTKHYYIKTLIIS